MKLVEKDLQKVIGGKRYNTSTAKYITSYSNGLGYADFKNFSEDLYQKRTGEFFLAGFGGPASKYKRPYPGGGSQGGFGIIPLSYKEAQEWVENYANEYYEQLFVLEEDEQTSFSLLMPNSLYQKINMFSSINDFYMKDFVVFACEYLFDHLPDEYSPEYEEMISEIRGIFLS